MNHAHPAVSRARIPIRVYEPPPLSSNIAMSANENSSMILLIHFPRAARRVICLSLLSRSWPLLLPLLAWFTCNVVHAAPPPRIGHHRFRSGTAGLSWRLRCRIGWPPCRPRPASPARRAGLTREPPPPALRPPPPSLRPPPPAQAGDMAAQTWMPAGGCLLRAGAGVCGNR